MLNAKSFIWYQKVFEQEMHEGRDVFDAKGEKLIIQEDEEFKQCYSDDDIARSVLPTSWFVSTTGNVIYVNSNGELVWKMKQVDDSGYEYYNYRHPRTGRNRNIMVQNLVGLVFGSYRFGKAQGLLDKNDIYAFGNMADDDNLNGHHKKPIKDFPVEKNNPDNIEIITTRTHKILHSVPDHNATQEEKNVFVKNLNKLADDEAPGKIVMVLGGKEKVIKAYDSMEELKKDIDNPFLQKQVDQFIRFINSIKS